MAIRMYTVLRLFCHRQTINGLLIIVSQLPNQVFVLGCLTVAPIYPNRLVRKINDRFRSIKL